MKGATEYSTQIANIIKQKMLDANNKEFKILEYRPELAFCSEGEMFDCFLVDKKSRNILAYSDQDSLIYTSVRAVVKLQEGSNE